MIWKVWPVLEGVDTKEDLCSMNDFKLIECNEGGEITIL